MNGGIVTLWNAEKAPRQVQWKSLFVPGLYPRSSKWILWYIYPKSDDWKTQNSTIKTYKRRKKKWKGCMKEMCHASRRRLRLLKLGTSAEWTLPPHASSCRVLFSPLSCCSRVSWPTFVQIDAEEFIKLRCFFSKPGTRFCRNFGPSPKNKLKNSWTLSLCKNKPTVNQQVVNRELSCLWIRFMYSRFFWSTTCSACPRASMSTCGAAVKNPPSIVTKREVFVQFKSDKQLELGVVFHQLRFLNISRLTIFDPNFSHFFTICRKDDAQWGKAICSTPFFSTKKNPGKNVASFGDSQQKWPQKSQVDVFFRWTSLLGRPSELGALFVDQVEEVRGPDGRVQRDGLIQIGLFDQELFNVWTFFFKGFKSLIQKVVQNNFVEPNSLFTSRNQKKKQRTFLIYDPTDPTFWQSVLVTNITVEGLRVWSGGELCHRFFSADLVKSKDGKYFAALGCDAANLNRLYHGLWTLYPHSGGCANLTHVTNWIGAQFSKSDCSLTNRKGMFNNHSLVKSSTSTKRNAWSMKFEPHHTPWKLKETLSPHSSWTQWVSPGQPGGFLNGASGCIWCVQKKKKNSKKCLTEMPKNQLSADPASPWPRQGGAWDHRRCGTLLSLKATVNGTIASDLKHGSLHDTTDPASYWRCRRPPCQGPGEKDVNSCTASWSWLLPCYGWRAGGFIGFQNWRMAPGPDPKGLPRPKM